MRATLVVVVLGLSSCQSGVALDLDGALRFPCTPQSSTERSKGGCPGELFCGADHTCHPPDVGGTYACRGDFECVGGFRCGPKGACLDPSGDALRADALDVALTTGRVVPASPPWGPVTVLAAGRTFYQSTPGGTLTDVSPVALSDGTDVWSFATSQQGFFGGTSPLRFFVGRAALPAGVGALAVARDQVFAIAGGNLYQYRWQPRLGQGPLAVLDAGVGRAAIGTHLRVGNSAASFVFEFTPDTSPYRVFDTSGAFTPVSGSVSGSLYDMADTDGPYVYAIVDDKVQAAVRSANPASWSFGTFAINSPGRSQLLDCGGTAAPGLTYVFRSLYVGDNPDLSEVEHPLVAVRVDVIGDGGVSRNWMRLDPDPSLPACGSSILRHVGRGTCPVCGPDEEFVDMQWGVDATTGTAGLRSECRQKLDPAGVRPIFYDLQTDATGFACLRTQRPGAEYRGPVTVRASSHASVAAVATGKAVQVRRDGFADWVALTLDWLPDVALTVDGKLLALGRRTLYRETELIGMAVHQVSTGTVAYPAWVSGDWLFYDDGRVGPLANLDRALQDGPLYAVPARRDLKPPVFGTQAKGSDGRTYVVMAASDALLGADLTSPSVALPPRTVEVRAVPEPQVELLSLAVLDPPAADAGLLFEGYALTRNRVFALEAATAQRWSLTPVEVEDAPWLEVWADHDRGRLGYADGRVYSLPSGVQLAPPLGRGVRDYQTHCGRAYALNETGLYRLDAQPHSGVGVWVRQAALNGGGARMCSAGASRELWVFGDDGTATLLTGDPCPP